jgi:hypothetical protein
MDQQVSWARRCVQETATIAAASLDGSGVYVSTNSGTTYILRLNVGFNFAVACSSDGTKIYVGNSVFYYSYDSGATFVTTSFANGGAGVACSSSGTLVYAVNQDTNVYRSINSGISFSTVFVTSQTVNGVCCSSDGTKVYACATNGIYYSSNSGVSYSSISSLSTSTVLSIACSSDASVVIFSTGSILYVSTDFGTTFIQRLTSAGTPSCSTSGKIIAATISNATISVSNDYGISWVSTGFSSADSSHTVKETKIIHGTGTGGVGVAPYNFSPLIQIGSSTSVAASNNPGFGILGIPICTISTAAAATSSVASSFRIDGPPEAGTNHTITNKYAFEVLGGTSNFNGLVSLSGPSSRPPRIITGATTLSATAGSSFVVATSGTFTITLPGIQTSAANGLEFLIVNAGSGTITLTVANTGTEKFNGAATTSLTLNQHDRTHIIAFTNTATSVYNWYNF